MRSLTKELAYTQKKSNGKKKAATPNVQKGRRKLGTLRAMSKKSKSY